VERCGAEIGVVDDRHTHLTLDLLAGPSSCVACATAEFCVRACLPRHSGEEVMTEVLPEVSVGEGIGEITQNSQSISSRMQLWWYLPNKTTRRPKKGFGAVAVILDGPQKIKDRVHVRDDELG
jgi:hypothetical protein